MILPGEEEEEEEKNDDDNDEFEERRNYLAMYINTIKIMVSL